jgi:hypothetical protein
MIINNNYYYYYYYIYPVRKADNLTTIPEQSVWTMWDAQHITTL